MDFMLAHVSVPVAVHALEGRVGREVRNAAEPLAGCLKALFPVADRNQEVLEVTL